MSALQHALPSSLRMFLRIGSVLYGLFILWQSLLPAGTGGAIPHTDKIIHAVVYALLAVGVSLSWPKLSNIQVAMICVVFGGVIELTQGAMPLGRTASVWDGLANGAGVIAALLILSLISRKFAR